jgi:hypothetical protein
MTKRFLISILALAALLAATLPAQAALNVVTTT